MDLFPIFLIGLLIIIPLGYLYISYFLDDKRDEEEKDDPDRDAKMFWWFGRRK